MSKIEREVNGIKFTVELGSGFDVKEYLPPSYRIDGVTVHREHFEAALRLAALHGVEPATDRIGSIEYSEPIVQSDAVDREDRLLRTSVFL